MLSKTQIEQFHRDGYLHSGQVLSSAEVEILQDEIARVIDDQGSTIKPQPVMLHNMGKTESPVWQIVDIFMASDAFRDLVHNEIIAEEVAQLTGARELRLWHDQIQYKPASTGGINMWHQDAPYWPVLRPDTQVTAWVALDDVDLENGCMSMVAGSHLWGNQIDYIHTIKEFGAMPSQHQDRPVGVHVCPVRKGEVHYHHSLTWHGSSANISGRPRRAIALHYMGDDTRFVAAGNHPMKPYIHSADGEPIEGDAFPLVWSREGGGAQ